MQYTLPTPPAASCEDLAILARALRRLCCLSRPLSTGDLADAETRLHYHLLRARAIALEAMRNGGAK